jgi:hypothetical protein
MKKKILLPLLAILIITFFYVKKQTTENDLFIAFSKNKIILKEKPKNSRALFAIEREKYELEMQRNPTTGNIPQGEKIKELDVSLNLMQQKRFLRTTASTYTSRGPSNFGGRTRAFAVDISDATSNTLLSGGVSSGLFRTTNGGASWTKVTPQGEIHNVTALAQDPRPGFQNIWYYGTGEWIGGNSAYLGAVYAGHGIYKSIDSGLTWVKILGKDKDFTVFDSFFDYTNRLRVHPTSGNLFIATTGRIFRYDGNTLTEELILPSNGLGFTDVVITANGKVYASFDGGTSLEGVWTSPTGNGSWTQIAKNGTPTDWAASGRIVLATAPSNNNIVYALYVNGNDGGIEGDLWQYNATTTSWVDYSAKLPDEPEEDSPGNDPFAVQGGYDLVVSVKPDDENFVVIGGTNAYKIEDITTEATFTRIGGYANNTGYAPYENHHPDIHALEFDPNTNNILYSGTDGGVHKTTNITAASIFWESLNNNYTTYQYYHVALDPFTGSNIVIGGAQDNGTTLGGTNVGLDDNTTMASIAGGDGVAVGITRRVTDLQLFFGVQKGIIYTNYPDNTGREITPTDAPSGEDAQFVTYFYLDPDNSDNLYYAGKTTLYKTNDAAAISSDTWVNAGQLTTNENLRTFATTRGTYNAATSFLLIGGDRGGIFKVNDPENVVDISTAVNMTPSGANTNQGSIVSGIAIHPTNPDIVLAVYANYEIDNIFLSTNATSATPTWTLVERNLSAHSIRSAAITQVGTEIIYFVGTSRGLYSSTDPTTKDWEMEGTNSIGLALISGLVYRPSDNKLLIGTHGNGMLETTVEGTLSNKEYTKSETKISFYPNPAQKELTIQSNEFDLSKKVVYRISDISGKTVKRGIVNSKKINIEDLNHGVYLVNLSIEGEKQNFKFIKN